MASYGKREKSSNDNPDLLQRIVRSGVIRSVAAVAVLAAGGDMLSACGSSTGGTYEAFAGIEVDCFGTGGVPFVEVRGKDSLMVLTGCQTDGSKPVGGIGRALGVVGLTARQKRLAEGAPASASSCRNLAGKLLADSSAIVVLSWEESTDDPTASGGEPALDFVGPTDSATGLAVYKAPGAIGTSPHCAMLPAHA